MATLASVFVGIGHARDDAASTTWWLNGQSGSGFPYKVAFRMYVIEGFVLAKGAPILPGD
jgi:hypothetical protein